MNKRLCMLTALWLVIFSVVAFGEYFEVNFRDIAVINDDQFDTPSLQYSGGTGNGWALEGYSRVQSGWQLLEGDILAYYVDQRATDDMLGVGTH